MPIHTITGGGGLRLAAEFQVSTDWHTGSLVNPLLDVSTFISNDRSDFNFANYKDRVATISSIR